jgi:HEPN domain-containing protein
VLTTVWEEAGQEAPSVNRLEWQQLAERWLVDARSLLNDQRWSAAYYLAGYAVECGLKACILARVGISPEVIFDERRFSERCWTHDLWELVKLADLEPTRVAEMTANAALLQHWLLVKDWRETTRYETTPHHKAKKLYKAITDKPNGVMSWVRSHW